MFRSSARKKVLRLGETHLREGQYNFFYTQPSECSSYFEMGKEFRMMNIFYSPLLLEELVPFFPELKSVIGANPGVLITQKPFWLPVTIKEITNQLFNCPYDENTRQFYFDLKVREVLYHMLENVFRQGMNKLSFTPWEINRIHEAKKILLDHIASKPPSIRELSRLVALNEYKLKKGFRQYFNSSIGQWMQEEKLQYSRELILNTNKPIKEICTLVGYPLTTNFITAFRKRFGVTPGELRRK
ncbi:AraC family transcriptional regulator [Agriterribacter sp.]|uniref:helix-turn-helix transcriptional regulator n=1 Tax=Agriterribacter sp. TaxID=2821509 RepID=UPI002D0A4F61|nr:AraC family transcriptional regulator [Agriterribacter sp.]HRO46343.1 AraC family transcriptional regulator [Agriterribacter sp.]HRQ17510.1 AraC family transcriptional regulator [Agriterribacter sp.]